MLCCKAVPPIVPGAPRRMDPGTTGAHGSRERSQARPPDTWTPRRFDHARPRRFDHARPPHLRPPHHWIASIMQGPAAPRPRRADHAGPQDISAPGRPDRRPAATPRRPDRRRAAILCPPRRRYSRQGRKEKKYFNFLIDAPRRRSSKVFGDYIESRPEALRKVRKRTKRYMYHSSQMQL